MNPKHQVPTSKRQRSAKPKTAEPVKDRRVFKYRVVTDKPLVLNEGPNGKETSKHPFNLEERTARFGEAVVPFSEKIPRDPTNNRLIDQVVGCGASIGGNYCEASEGVSKNDFRNMISRCVKESKETKFFLRMLAASEPQLADEAREQLSRGQGAASDFASIFRKTRGDPL